MDEAQLLFDAERYSEAIPLLMALAEQENPDALALLGLTYQLGLGVPHDGEKALWFLEKAVALGHGASAHNLRTVYATGLPGVAASAERSRYYYRLARNLGCQVAPDEFYQ